jgi:hypothetical protein
VGLLIRLFILPFRHPIASIVIGITILGGVYAMNWDSAPTCGGATMKQGDVCHRLTDTSDTHDKTYDEARSSQNSAPTSGPPWAELWCWAEP